MKPENEIIAHNIKLLRGINKETQPEFGNRLGSNQKAIWAYEKGNVRPKPGFLLQLSRTYGITPETLLNIKLKANRSGNITNLPKADKEFGKLYKQLDELLDEQNKQFAVFKVQTQKIFNKLGEYLRK